MYECVKCSNEGKNAILHGGAFYNFCSECLDAWEIFPTSSIEEFIGPGKELKVTRNMRLARERRARGERVWS